MKNLLLFITLFWIFPSSFTINEPPIQANITITRNNLTVKTTLHHNKTEWSVINNELLKTGVNKFYFVLTEKQAVNLEVINYE